MSTAKYITQLTERLKAQAVDLAAQQARFATLELECSFLRNVAKDAVADRDAVLVERNEVAAKLHEAQVKLAERSTQDALFYTATISILGHVGADAMRNDPVAHLTTMVCGHAAEVACLHSDHRKTVDILKERIAELEQRGAMLDQKESEINAMVAKVEGRMRRDEREEAQAILNRRALAVAVPGKLRR